MAWLDRLKRHTRTLLAKKVPVILAGDYNVVPTGFDIYQSRSWKDDAVVQSAARKRLHDVVMQGWTDALRAKYPNSPNLFTYWDYKRKRWERNAGIRLDHFLLSPALAAALSDAWRRQICSRRSDASDHAPA